MPIVPPQPARILLVDFDPASRHATAEALRRRGWEVLEAGSSAEAMEQATGVELVIFEGELPGEFTQVLASRLRSPQLAFYTPIIRIVTVDAKQTGAQASGDFDFHLSQPADQESLAAAVATLLRVREADQFNRRSDARFQAVFNNSSNGIAVLTETFVIADVNPALAQMLNLKREEIVARPLSDFAPPERQDELYAICRTIEQRQSWGGIFPLVDSAGKHVQLEWKASPHSDPGQWLIIVDDITARIEFEREREELLGSERAARAEAERANRLKDDFLATLSHELRTPLNAIVGWSELLKLGRLDAADFQEGVAAIERNAKIQAQMISDLLDVSRITSGKLRLDVQTIDPATTIESSLAVIMPAAEAKNIAIQSSLDAHAGLVSADPARLQQILWNLLNNAVKFAPEGGRIGVELRRSGAQVEVIVSDNGKGISPELLPFIFERFRQGDLATTRGHSGLGLGLAIVKQLVEMHGGSVHADSGGEGQGAAFTVSLPALNIRSTRAAGSTTARETSAAFRNAPDRLKGVRVLIVDDDSDARILTRRVIADTGVETHDVGSVAEALEAIDEFRPHVLVSDLGMPHQDGFDLIRQVRSRGYTYHDLPAVALTAFARTEDRRRALLAGFQVHLAKPVDPIELTAVIATLVGRTGGDAEENSPRHGATQ